jgi:hypothetical protein
VISKVLDFADPRQIKYINTHRNRNQKLIIRIRTTSKSLMENHQYNAADDNNQHATKHRNAKKKKKSHFTTKRRILILQSILRLFFLKKKIIFTLLSFDQLFLQQPIDVNK